MCGYYLSGITANGCVSCHPGRVQSHPEGASELALLSRPPTSHTHTTANCGLGPCIPFATLVATETASTGLGTVIAHHSARQPIGTTPEPILAVAQATNKHLTCSGKSSATGAANEHPHLPQEAPSHSGNIAWAPFPLCALGSSCSKQAGLELF